MPSLNSMNRVPLNDPFLQEFHFGPNALSSLEIARTLAAELKEYSSLVYVRHALATDPHPVFVFAANNDSNTQADLHAQLTSNWTRGVQPLAMAIDSLSEERSASYLAIVNMRLVDGDALEAVCGPEVSTLLVGRSWLKPVITSERDAFCMRAHLREYGAYDSVASGPLRRIASNMGLRDGPLTVRTLMGAVVDAMHYERWWATGECTTWVWRHPKAFDFAFGVTIWQPNVPADILVSRAVQRMREVTSRPIAGALARLTQDFSTTSFDDESASQVPEPVVSACIKHMGNAPDAVRFNVAHFLDFAQQFCDETHERDELEFGLLLSNPFLVRYFPGPLPVPVLWDRDDAPTFRHVTMRGLKDQLHVSAFPENNLLVVPYRAVMFKNRKSLDGALESPVYVVDARDFRRSAIAWERFPAWSSTGGLYAFLSHRMPWSVAAVAGPGAQMRVYAAGDIVAVRSGKGWRHRAAIQIPNGVSATIVELLVKLSLQLSPFVRPKMRGGFIIYTPTPDVPTSLDLTALAPEEPSRLSGGGWLKGQPLLRDDGGGRLGCL